MSDPTGPAGDSRTGRTPDDGLQVEGSTVAEEGHATDLEHEHGEASFWSAVAERTIGLRSMSRRLRLLTGLAVAQAVVAAVFLALRGAHLPMTVAKEIANNSAGVISIPTVVLWISVAFLVVAWAYILAGAFDAALAIRIGALVVFAGVMALLWLNTGVHGVSGVLEIVLVVVIWAGGGWSFLRRRARLATDAPLEQTRERPQVIGLAGIGAVVAAIYLLVWFGPASGGPSSQLFASAVFEQIGVMAVVLIPALLLAASEFAEWGEVVGDRVSAATRFARSSRLLVECLLAAAVAIAVLVHLLVGSGLGLLRQLGIATVATAIVLVVGLRLTRSSLTDEPEQTVGAGEGRPTSDHVGGQAAARSRRLPHAVPYVGVVLVAVSFYVVSSGDLLIRNSSAFIPSATELALGGKLIPYEQGASPAFSMRYPSGWTVQRVPPDYTLFNGGDFGSDFLVLRVHVPASRFDQTYHVPVAAAIEGVVQEIYVNQLPGHPVAHFRALARDGQWLEQSFSLNAAGRATGSLAGTGWETILHGRVWVLVGTTHGKDPLHHLKTQLFTSMWRSFSDDSRRYGAVAVPAKLVVPAQGLPVYSLAFWGLVGLAALGMLLMRGRRLAPRRVGIALFALVVALAYLGTGGMGGTGTAGTSATSSGSGWLHLAGIQAAAAIATLLLLAVLVARRRLDDRGRKLVALLLMLDIGLQIAAWMFELYGGAINVSGQFSVAQGIIVFAALIWELTFSGVTMTNADSTALPRHARVLVFCGYIMLVATTVLFFSSLHVQSTGSRLEPVFETDAWAERGIVFLAVPLLITVFSLRTMRLFDVTRAGNADGIGGRLPVGPRVRASRRRSTREHASRRSAARSAVTPTCGSDLSPPSQA